MIDSSTKDLAREALAALNSNEPIHANGRTHRILRRSDLSETKGHELVDQEISHINQLLAKGVGPGPIHHETDGHWWLCDSEWQDVRERLNAIANPEAQTTKEEV